MTTRQKIEMLEDYVKKIKENMEDMSIEVKKSVLALEYQLKLEKLFEVEE